MLLGCCHCEDIPPSSSGSSSGSSSSNIIVSCTVCGVAPRGFNISITNPSDASACCCSNYSGSFALSYVSGCSWESAERMLCAVRPNPGAAYCVTASIDKPRITMSIGFSAGVYSYTIQYRYHRRGISTSDEITHTYSAGSLASCFVSTTAVWQSTASTGTAAAQCAAGPQFIGNPCAVTSAFTSVNSFITVAPA